MNRAEWSSIVVAILDDAGGVIRTRDTAAPAHLLDIDDCVIIGYEIHGTRSAWAVRSYLGGDMDLDEASDIVESYLDERGLFYPYGPVVATCVYPPEQIHN